MPTPRNPLQKFVRGPSPRVGRSLALALLALVAAITGAVPGSAQSSTETGEVEPGWVATRPQATDQRLNVDRRSPTYPINLTWVYTSTVNNRTYRIPGAEFCVFSAATDEKVGCTRTNNAASLVDHASVRVPELGSYYISLAGTVLLRDNPTTIPWFDPLAGRLQYWQALTATGVRCFGKSPTYLGTPAAENTRGTNGQDIVYLGSGDDIFRGLGGNDIACGGNGNDTMIGNDGVDRMKGGRGRDVLRGDAGNDILFGGESRDVVIGGAGTDRCQDRADILRSC